MSITIDFAPLEGITTYPFRNAHAALYGGVDRYFTPFVNVNQDFHLGRPDERDLAVTNNRPLLDGGCRLVPQLIGNQPELLCYGALHFEEMGYPEVNWNLGCPSPTVTKRMRGSGLLADPDRIDRILDEWFTGLEKQGSHIRVSVKSRIGMEDSSHLEELIRVYNRYPLSEVILHPRLGSQQYEGEVDLAAFRKALSISRHPMTYNGDILSLEEARMIEGRFPAIRGIMIGRGLLMRPWMLEEEGPDRKTGDGRFRLFHDRIIQGYQDYIPDDGNVLAKMKELWGWWIRPFRMDDGTLPHDLKKAFKALRKAGNMASYRAAEEAVLELTGL